MTPLPRKFSLKVVGVTFVDRYPDNLYELEAVAAHAYLDTDKAEPIPALLIHNPDNANDPNAVEVHVPAVGMLGHVPRSLAARLAPELDDGKRWQAHVVSVLVHPDNPANPGISVHCERVPESDGASDGLSVPAAVEEPGAPSLPLEEPAGV